MNISETFTQNLLKRAFSYVESGYYDLQSWMAQMESFLAASNNDLMGWSENDIHNMAVEVWNTEFTHNTKSLTIAKWAAEYDQTTRIQHEVHNNIDRLFQSIEDYRRGDFFREMLSFCARFTDLAPYNAAMVKTQMPEARYVLTEKKWKDIYHRKLKRNARPLVILRKFGPVSYVYEIGDTENTSQQSLFGFYKTEEEILNTLANPYETTGEVDPELYENLKNNLSYYGIALDTFRVAADFGAQIIKESCEVKVRDIKTKGYYVISVNEKADDSTAFASICHELGHYFCRHLAPPYQRGDKWWKVRRPSWKTREFEAEIVSFIICERYGVGNRSWEYLSRVLGQNDMIPQDISMERVLKAANRVERMLDENLNPRSCFLYKNETNFKKEYDRRYPRQKGEIDEDDE